MWKQAAVLIPVLALAASPAAGQIAPLWGDLKPGVHTVGFRLVEAADSTRLEPGGTGVRAVRISVWYPARPGAAQAMRLRDYAHRLAGGGVSPRAAERRALAIAIAPGFPESRLDEVMALATEGRFEARPATGRFPVLVFGQGWGYESPLFQVVLAEYLASHGYVVAAAPLVGTRNPIPRVTAADLETEVRDMEVVLARTARLPFADAGRLAAAGFDLGGMAGVLLAMSRDDIDAYVSIDSGILSRRLVDDLLRPSPRFDPLRLRAATLAVTRPSAELAAQRLDEDLTLLDSAVHARGVYVLRVPGMRHADFTLFGPLEGVLPNFWGPPRGEPARRSPMVARQLLAFLEAHLRGDAAALAGLGPNPGGGLTGEWRRRAPTAPDPFADALAAEALAGDVAAAIARHRGARPDAGLVQRVGSELLFRRGDAAGAVRWLEFGVRSAPTSVPVRELLGDAHAARGDRTAAAASYREALRLEPANAAVSAKLERLGNPP